jgi:hypothetical protein
MKRAKDSVFHEGVGSCLTVYRLDMVIKVSWEGNRSCLLRDACESLAKV